MCCFYNEILCFFLINFIITYINPFKRLYFHYLRIREWLITCYTSLLLLTYFCVCMDINEISFSLIVLNIYIYKPRPFSVFNAFWNGILCDFEKFSVCLCDIWWIFEKRIILDVILMEYQKKWSFFCFSIFSRKSWGLESRIGLVLNS